MSYQTTKLLSGFSTCFRQWRADSHCNMLHGYALEFELIFECEELDERNWCVDFGSFKLLKEQLAFMFDHTTVVAADDPYIVWFEQAGMDKILKLRTLEQVGCEMFAQLVFNMAEALICDSTKRVRVVSCKCIENKNNSSTFLRKD